MSDKWLEVKVLDETVKARQSQLDKVDSAISRSEEKLKSLQDSIREIGADKAKALRDLSIVKKRLDDTIAEVQHKIDSTNFQLRTVESEVVERKRYLDDQESLISQTVDNGNEELRVIKYELEELQRVKSELEQEVYSSRSVLSNLRVDIERERGNLEGITRQYESDEKVLQARIDILKHNITTALEKYNLVVQEVDQKLSILKEKEESLIAREEALKEQKLNVEEREHRLRSAERLYS